MACEKCAELRKHPCVEDPVKLKGQPIGMYHCPECGEMQIAGLPHTTPMCEDCFDKLYVDYMLEQQHKEIDRGD